MPMLVALCAAATSQAQTPPSPVINNQIQLGDVFATQTIDVVTVEEGVGAETTATGNSVLAAGDGSDLSITSNQTMAGATRAQTVVDASTGLGESSQINTTATGVKTICTPAPSKRGPNKRRRPKTNSNATPATAGGSTIGSSTNVSTKT